MGIASSDLAGNTKGYIGTRYNDGTGLVGSQFITIYGEDNSKDFGVDYNYTYYGAKGAQSPDALLRLSFNGEMYQYEYDRLGRLVTRKSTIAPTEGGTTVQQRLASGKKEIYTYVTAEPVGGIAETTTLVHSYTDILGVCHYYDYDELGNITEILIEYSKDEKYTIDYHYDAHSRLTRCDNEYLGYTVAYSYDNRGNITSCEEYEYTTGALTEDILYYSYDYTYDNTVWKDLLTEYDGETITYDGIGNPLSWMGTALTWQNGRQLATYGSGSKLVTYGYDGDGLRISKSGARNTEYIIVGGTYVGERTTINGTEYLIAYLYGDSGIVGINVNGTNYYFVKNLQGDITGIIDTAGNVVARYTYDAYGVPIDITDGDGNAISRTNHTHIANLNPFRYRGYTYDQETGFYYLTTRYYDPYVGRFLNADGLVSTGVGLDGYNMFAYCNNNPVLYLDSTGKCLFSAIAYITSVAIKIVTKVCEFIDSHKKNTPPTSISDDCVEFLTSYETYSSDMYYDAYGNPTIGYGHLIKPGENYKTITKEQAMDLFKQDVAYFENVVYNYMVNNSIQWTQNQFDAMVSVAFNSGPKGFENIANRIQNGWDIQQAFTWYYTQEKALAGGEDLGLWRRRMDEYEIYMYGSYNRDDGRLP